MRGQGQEVASRHWDRACIGHLDRATTTTTPGGDPSRTSCVAPTGEHSPRSPWHPANIFFPAGRPGKGTGQRFKSADGRADLSIYSLPNEAGETPATYLRHNLRMDRSALQYTRIARSFFAISSEREGVILYSRCNFSKRGRGAIHCFDLVYPQQEKRSWDAVVTRISLSLRPLEG